MTAPVDARARASWAFDEKHDSVLPVDAAGGVADLEVPAGLVRPDVIGAPLTGFGRNFVRASLTGLVVADAVDALRLRRAVTIKAMVRPDVAAIGAAGRGVVVQRGRGGASSPASFGLVLVVTATAPPTISARLFWDTEAGVRVEDTGVPISVGSDAVMVGATREVVGGQFVVRYDVNGQAFGGGTHALDAGGVSGADVSVGAGMNGAAYLDHFDGTLEALEVLDEALSTDEFAWLWDRVARAIPEAITAVRRLQPPGIYSQNPESLIQRELAVEGNVLGLTKSVARRLRDYGLPDRAWGETLERWERLTLHSPRPGDDLDVRRERVVSFLGTIRGYSVTDVRAELAELFDQDAADVEIVEFDNDQIETFTAGTPSAKVKVEDGNGAWLSDAAAVAAGYQQFTQSAATLSPGRYLYSIPSAERAEFRFSVERVTGSDFSVGGFAFGKQVPDDEWLYVGLTWTGAGSTQQVAYYKAHNGVVDTSFPVDIADPYPTNPVFFRVLYQAGGNYLVKFGASDAAADAHAGVLITGGPVDPKWAGPAALQGGLSTNHSYRFDSILIRTPHGPQRFNWYAYRDPGLPGHPDMVGAQLVVRRIKPAHTHAAAVSKLTVICDDPDSRVDIASRSERETMALPTTRNRTYVPGVTPVNGADLNDLQDRAIAAHARKHGDVTRTLTPVLRTAGSWAIAGTFGEYIQSSGATPGSVKLDGFLAGDRLKSIMLEIYGNGTADLTWSIGSTSGGLNAGSSSVVVTNPAASWATTTLSLGSGLTIAAPGAPSVLAGIVNYLWLEPSATGLRVGNIAVVFDHP